MPKAKLVGDLITTSPIWLKETTKTIERRTPGNKGYPTKFWDKIEECFLVAEEVLNEQEQSEYSENYR